MANGNCELQLPLAITIQRQFATENCESRLWIDIAMTSCSCHLLLWLRDGRVQFTVAVTVLLLWVTTVNHRLSIVICRSMEGGGCHLAWGEHNWLLQGRKIDCSRGQIEGIQTLTWSVRDDANGSELTILLLNRPTLLALSDKWARLKFQN